MKNKSIIGILLVIIIVIVFISLNCSSPGTSKVTIHINLGLNKASAANTFENSIFDRIFRLFTKDAEAQYVPPVTSIILNISGSGMETISNTYPASTTSIDLEVPSGPSRLFEVLASTGSATLRGAVTESLVGGTSVTIPISMALSQVRLILPDSSNARIVQINDLPLQLTSPVWIAKDATNTPNGLYLNAAGINVFRPYDIDFDSQGRIYMVNWNNADTVIIRIDDINDTTPEIFNTGITDMVGLAVDRVNRVIYFGNGTQLCRCNDYDCSSIKSNFTMTGITTLRGIAVTDTGLLLIAHDIYFSVYDPNLGDGIIIHSLSYPGGSPTQTQDMCVKGSRIYGASYDTGVTNTFIREFSLNESNQLIPAGIYNTSLYGPRRFIKTMSDSIYFNDENMTLDRLVSIDDISGAGRIDYGSNGNELAGPGRFDFFE